MIDAALLCIEFPTSVANVMPRNSLLKDLGVRPPHSSEERSASPDLLAHGNSSIDVSLPARANCLSAAAKLMVVLLVPDGWCML